MFSVPKPQSTVYVVDLMDLGHVTVLRAKVQRGDDCLWANFNPFILSNSKTCDYSILL